MRLRFVKDLKFERTGGIGPSWPPPPANIFDPYQGESMDSATSKCASEADGSQSKFQNVSEIGDNA